MKGRKTGGRKPGSQNKTTTQLKEAILLAADGAHEDGAVGYLIWLSRENTSAFASLLGRVLPTTLAGDKGNPIAITELRRTLVRPEHSDR
jgi:hypothetical protein